MIKDKKIFDGATIVVDGKKVRVLTAPYHISRIEIPDELSVYSLIKKGDHYMVDDMNTDNADFAMSMISHSAVPLGTNIEELTNCDMLYGPTARMSINEYFVETVGTIKLYVMMPDDIDSKEVVKRLNAAGRCFAVACGRNIDDIEILNQVDEIDPYDIDTNFENDVDRNIYRLTKKLRIMSKATHILDMSRTDGIVLRNPCCVEREVCEKYNLNRIDVTLIATAVRKIRKYSDDLDVIMGKTSVVGIPSRPSYFGNNPTPYSTPGLDGYDYICDPTTGFAPLY